VGTFEVEGASMEPTLRSQQYVFVDTLLLHSRPPQRGDVIVFHYPGNPTLEYVKRVVGLPRETIAVAHGRVWINGQPLREPYVREIPRYFWGPATVPADSLFVLGDNRNRSSDSHLWGPVPLRYVIGRAWLAWGPFAKWTWLGGQAPRIEAVGDERPPSARSRRS
jgi:signal peptidase I